MNISQEEEERYEKLQLIALDYARAGNTKELETMINHGMSVDLSTHKDDSLLMLATYNGHIETTKMLINQKANIDKINQRGQTPLEGVCFKGYMGIVSLLVENGANFQGKAIVYASMFGHKEIVQYLEVQGIDKKSLSILGISVGKIALAVSSFKSFFGFNRN